MSKKVLFDSYLIGSSSSAATLTALFADNIKTINIEGIHQGLLDIEFAPGEANNYIEIQIEFGSTSNNVFKRVTRNAGSTNETVYTAPFKFTGASVNTTYKLEIPFDIANKWIRISTRELTSLGGTPTTFGTTTIIGIFTEEV